MIQARWTGAPLSPALRRELGRERVELTDGAEVTLLGSPAGAIEDKEPRGEHRD